MSYLAITDVKRIGTPPTTCEVTFSSDFDYLFTSNTFYTDYDRDLADVPDGVLAIPALATLAPIAWAEGADLLVSELDRNFYYALHNLQAAWKELPVEYTPQGNIHAKNIIDYEPDTKTSKRGLLFSGGVDSLYSFVETPDDDPLLITVQGSDISLGRSEEMAHAEKHIQRFADARSLDHTSIASNFSDIVDTPLIDHYHRRNQSRGWWGAIQHGLALLGLCAPLTMTDHITAPTISSESAQADIGMAVDPRLINRIRWVNAHAEIVGDGVRRQQKIEGIAEYVDQEGGGDSLHIRSCFRGGDARNCLECEKCARTALGLLFAGLDPREHGYPIDTATFDDIRWKLRNEEWTFKQINVGYWEDLQAAADPSAKYPIEGATEFAEWLSNADVSSFKTKGKSPRTKRDFIPDPVYPYAYRARKYLRNSERF